MPGTTLVVITLLAALGSGLIAGVFFAFSTFVMKALGRLPADAGVAAMQSINVVVINALFLGVFFVTATASAVAIAIAVWRWGTPGSVYMLVGGALYLVGTFGVTIACNVLLNNVLATVPPTAADAVERWDEYRARWTAWNHVRTAAALAAAGAFTLALRD